MTSYSTSARSVKRADSFLRILFMHCLLKNSRTLCSIFMITLLAACGGSGETTLGNSGNPGIETQTLSELSQSLGFITPIAYIRRSVPDTELLDVTDPIDMLDLDAFNPGATLWIRAGASSTANEFPIAANIFGEGTNYDVKDISVSPDGAKILFAMHAPEDDLDDPIFTWNIWEFDLENLELRRIIVDDIAAEAGHDINPIYLPNGDILFASTRQSASQAVLNDEGKVQFQAQVEAEANNANEAAHAFNLHVVNPPETGEQTIRQITFNQSHDFAPILQANGKILYSRWDNIANNDRISLYEVNSDGSEHQLKYGYHSIDNPADGGIGFFSQPRISPNNLLVAITQTNPNTLINLGGDIVEIDVANFIDNNTPTFNNLGLTTQAIQSLSPSGVDVENPFELSGRYISAWPLHDGTNRILVSWAQCRLIETSDPNNPNIIPCLLATENIEPNDPQFEIWVLNPNEGTQTPVVLASPGEYFSEVVAMEAIAFEPALTNDLNIGLLSTDQAILNIRSIYDLDGVDIAAPDSGLPTIANLADPAITSPDNIDAKFLRLVKAVSIPDEDILDFDNDIFGVNRNQLMREIIGYVPIEPDGSVRAIVPANIPLMLSIVNRDGKRINIENPNASQRHQNWIHLTPGTTLECRGCHSSNSELPHGRLEAQAPSVHLGASVTLPYPNTDPLLFSPNGGETMAEIFTSANNIDGHLPVMDLDYSDVWTDDSGSLTKAMPFSINYADLETLGLAIPASSACSNAWGPFCRITINYEQHIHPLWELSRPDIDDGNGALTPGTCINCHTTNAGTEVPAGQLDLTSVPSDVNAAHFSSYRELLRADVEQVLNGTALANRLWECNQVVDGNPVIDPNSDPMAPTFLREFRMPNNIPASMSEAGANFGASDNFFNCLTQDNACRTNIGDTLPAAFPDECIEFAGNPVTSQAIVNHNGLLSDVELRIISEWLDIGAQYYNNPFAAP